MRAGDRFNRLVLTGRAGHSAHHPFWFADCDCGTKAFRARADKLKDGRQQSCGCLRKEMADRAHSTRLAELEERNEAVNAFKHARAVERAIEEIGNQHQRTKEQLDGDGVPEEDPLRNPKFYAELVRDGCIFCGKQESHWLFKVRYTERLWAGNAVPACPLCQERAEHYQDVFSFEEMSLIGQTIQFIRLNRANKGLPEIVTKKEIDETQ